MIQDISKKVVVLGTGGTIAGVATHASDNLGYVAGTLGVEQLLGGVAGLSATTCNWVSEQVAQLDSKDMNFRVLTQLALRCNHWLRDPDVQGIVITHGTDTLEETAYFLRQVLPDVLIGRKPVVLTCAMRPASSQQPDGPQNLLDAVSVAQNPGAQGVLIVCAGRVHSALHVQKIHPYRLDAFDSGEAGPLGVVEEGRVRWLCSLPGGLPSAALNPPVVDTGSAVPGHAAMDKLMAITDWPRVEIVVSHAGADGWIVDALLAAPPALANKHTLRGIVVAGTGNGTVHCELEGALLRAQVAGIRVVRATRCPYGTVQPTEGAVIAESTALSPVKARVALALELAGI